MDDAPAAPRPTKAELMARIDRSWARLAEIADREGDARLTAPGGADGWSVKDHLAHVATWERSLLALLAGHSRAAAVGVDEATNDAADTDRRNALIYERNRDRPLSDVLAFFRQSHADVLAALAPLSDDDLFQPYSHYQPEDLPANPNPVIGWIAGNTFGHYDEHLGWIWALLDPAAPAAPAAP